MLLITPDFIQLWLFNCTHAVNHSYQHLLLKECHSRHRNVEPSSSLYTPSR